MGTEMEPRKTGNRTHKLGLPWLCVGVAVMVLTALAVTWGGGLAARIAVGVALSVCLLMIGLMAWVARRDSVTFDEVGGRRDRQDTVAIGAMSTPGAPRTNDLTRE